MFCADWKSAKVAQLVEHDLAKVGVASSNLVFRSKASVREAFFMLINSSDLVIIKQGYSS
jgi:hypothetical protein